MNKWIWGLLGALIIPCWVIGYQYNTDFRVLYYISQVMGQDVNMVYGPNASAGRFFYGPLTLPLIAPLALATQSISHVGWLVLQSVAYGIFFWGLIRLFPVLTKSAWVWVFVWAFCINPVHNNFQSNNIQLMLIAAIVVAEICTRTDSSRLRLLGGALVALAAAIKVFPGFVAVMYLIAKPKSVKWGVVLGSALSVLIPLVYFGFGDTVILFQGFLTNLTTYTDENSLVGSPDILCLPTLLARAFSPGVHVSAFAETLTRWSSLALCLGYFYLLWAGRKVEGIEKHLWSLGLALMVFINPSSRPHYFVFYIPAMCSLVEIWRSNARGNSLLLTGAVFSWALIALTAQGVVGKDLNNMLELLSVPTLGMVVLCATLTVAVVNLMSEQEEKSSVSDDFYAGAREPV